MYVQDDAGNPLAIEEWSITMDFARSTTSSVILEVTPDADADDGPGEFTVYLASDETELLETDDEFDIQMASSGNAVVWTVLQGKVLMVEDITG